MQGELAYERVYADLLSKLPKWTEVTIFAHPDVEADLRSIVGEHRKGATTNVVVSPDFLNFTVWAEDPYVVVQDTDPASTATYLVEPFTFTRAGDALIAERVAQASPFQSTQSPLYFQGGNVLIDDDFVLLGIDYLYNTLETFRTTGAVSIPAGVEPFEFITGLFARTFGEDLELFFPGTRLPVPQQQEAPIQVDGQPWTEIRYMGTGDRQPIFHIDIVPVAGRTGGRRQVPGAGRIALGGRPHPRPGPLEVRHARGLRRHRLPPDRRGVREDLGGARV